MRSSTLCQTSRTCKLHWSFLETPGAISNGQPQTKVGIGLTQSSSSIRQSTKRRKEWKQANKDCRSSTSYRSYFPKTMAARIKWTDRTFDFNFPTGLYPRSEERRVGKECRS